MREDFLLDDNFDIIDLGEEWAEGDSTELDVELIFLTDKGDNREFPFSGFGAERRLKARIDEQKFVRELTIELENDSFSPSIDISNGISQPIIEV
jgi:hypothetical protein